jgi:hypothetical protein
MGNLAGEGATTPESITRANAYKALEKQKTSSDLADSWGRELAQREAKTAGVADHLRANAGTLAGMGLGGLAGVAAGSGKDEKGERSGLHMGLGGLAGAAAGGALGRRNDVLSQKNRVLGDYVLAQAKRQMDAAMKTAGIGGMLGGLAKANPGALIGAGLGAAGGLANGLQKDQNGQRHIMSGLAQGAMGAAAGGLAGHAAQNIGSAVQGGATLGAAAKGYGTNMLGKAQAQIPGIVDKAKGVVGSAQGKLQGMFGKAPGTGTPVSAT